MEAGFVLRPNNSLAGTAGSDGLASGGSGFGDREPLSCAVAAPARKRDPISVRIRIVFMGAAYRASTGAETCRMPHTQTSPQRPSSAFGTLVLRGALAPIA